MGPRRLPAALAVSCACLAASGAAAQIGHAGLAGPVPALPASTPARPALPEFRAPPGDLREPGVPRRNGLIAAYPLSDAVRIGVGRFLALELAGPRTHLEAERRPADMRRRDRGIAAVGVSISF